MAVNWMGSKRMLVKHVHDEHLHPQHSASSECSTDALGQPSKTADRRAQKAFFAQRQHSLPLAQRDSGRRSASGQVLAAHHREQTPNTSSIPRRRGKSRPHIKVTSHTRFTPSNVDPVSKENNDAASTRGARDNPTSKKRRVLLENSWTRLDARTERWARSMSTPLTGAQRSGLDTRSKPRPIKAQEEGVNESSSIDRIVDEERAETSSIAFRPQSSSSSSSRTAEKQGSNTDGQPPNLMISTSALPSVTALATAIGPADAPVQLAPPTTAPPPPPAATEQLSSRPSSTPAALAQGSRILARTLSNAPGSFAKRKLAQAAQSAAQ
ncbi:hypothetical protein V8E36_001782 [Tilletia maclaganii]